MILGSFHEIQLFGQDPLGQGHANALHRGLGQSRPILGRLLEPAQGFPDFTERGPGIVQNVDEQRRFIFLDPFLGIGNDFPSRHVFRRDTERAALQQHGIVPGSSHFRNIRFTSPGFLGIVFHVNLLQHYLGFVNTDGTQEVEHFPGNPQKKGVVRFPKEIDDDTPVFLTGSIGHGFQLTPFFAHALEFFEQEIVSQPVGQAPELLRLLFQEIPLGLIRAPFGVAYLQASDDFAMN